MLIWSVFILTALTCVAHTNLDTPDPEPTITMCNIVCANGTLTLNEADIGHIDRTDVHGVRKLSPKCSNTRTFRPYLIGV
ncbi:hypothetical protein Btru_056123 [Bulinus truncatus]|nr:hypothetical protein Btru_056123 [Bulinus truncatus]